MDDIANASSLYTSYLKKLEFHGNRRYFCVKEFPKGIPRCNLILGKRLILYQCFPPITDSTFSTLMFKHLLSHFVKHFTLGKQRHANVQNRIFCKFREETFHVKIPPFPKTEMSKKILFFSNMFSLKREGKRPCHTFHLCRYKNKN